MTPTLPSSEEAAGLVRLFCYLESESARQAFACLLLGFSRMDGSLLEFERHGEVSSVRVREDIGWTFSFSAARMWVKVWVRPPEVRTGRLSFETLKGELTQSSDRGDDHFTLRVADVDEAQRFLGLVYASRGA